MLAEFGIPNGPGDRHMMAAALMAMRAAPHTYPALKPLCIYHRHQRSARGPSVGEVVPNLWMARLMGPRGGGGGGSRAVGAAASEAPAARRLLAAFDDAPSSAQWLVVAAGSYS